MAVDSFDLTTTIPNDPAQEGRGRSAAIAHRFTSIVEIESPIMICSASVKQTPFGAPESPSNAFR
jgi:hypothetical protein